MHVELIDHYLGSVFILAVSDVLICIFGKVRVLIYMFFPRVVKVANFWVSSVQTESRVMTTETGTYHWMALEVHFTSM